MAYRKAMIIIKILESKKKPLLKTSNSKVLDNFVLINILDPRKSYNQDLRLVFTINNFYEISNKYSP